MTRLSIRASSVTIALLTLALWAIIILAAWWAIG